ncbi:MAG: hypothetical protein LBT23_02830 [Synergistaceae bacterium]|nr:hypothetical protein [Synergistaceae bacterium]
MKSAETTKTEADVFCFEKFAIDEDAINTIATIMGFMSTDIFHEEKKENPDAAKIGEMRRALRVMSRERQDIYSGNDEVKRSVIERYTPIIRERLANA